MYVSFNPMNARHRGYSIPTAIAKCIACANGWLKEELLVKKQEAAKLQGFFAKLLFERNATEAEGTGMHSL